MVITIYHPEVVGVHACWDSVTCARAFMSMYNMYLVESGRRTGRYAYYAFHGTHTGDCSHLSCRVCGINLERELDCDTNRRFE